MPVSPPSHLSTLLPFANLSTLNPATGSGCLRDRTRTRERKSVYWAGVWYAPKEAEKGAEPSAEAPWSQVTARTLCQDPEHQVLGVRAKNTELCPEMPSWRRKREEIPATNPKVQGWKARRHSEHSSWAKTKLGSLLFLSCTVCVLKKVKGFFE